MGKIVRVMVAVIALVAFGLATLAVAAEYYVVKDAAGKASVTDKKPADPSAVVKGPFKTKKDADDALKSIAAGGAAKPAGKAESPKKKPVKPPEEGC